MVERALEVPEPIGIAPGDLVAINVGGQYVVTKVTNVRVDLYSDSGEGYQRNFNDIQKIQPEDIERTDT